MTQHSENAMTPRKAMQIGQAEREEEMTGKEKRQAIALLLIFTVALTADSLQESLWWMAFAGALLAAAAVLSLPGLYAGRSKAAKAAKRSLRQAAARCTRLKRPPAVSRRAGQGGFSK